MKKLFLLLIITLISCSDGGSSDRNPYLTEYNFSYEINLNLPLYANLSTSGNSMYISGNNVGIKGIMVINIGNNFFAWEASCPNHSPNSCSTMKIEGGVTCRCECEDYLYSLANGAPLSESDSGEKLYGLLNYRVDVNGNILYISN
ncbi:Rieske (2Fe-2S) protein [Abyssalbus ytuae]|uniref:Rieske domain-containing protein n=1 Tax=Abyssalbus ytuae TaxID=2926907 RepID=A0A9E7D224_9FLAO|nr:hypothetical protein [Abyssalbus ytuae]UOB16254.1 hypothetical protein MQE35_10950 [Abyssalbus ytuae]